MKSSITLLENEKILFEGAPQSSFKYFSMFASLVCYILLLGIFLGLAIFQGFIKWSLLVNFISHHKENFVDGAVLVVICYYLYVWRSTTQLYYIITNQRYIKFSGLFGTTKTLLSFNKIIEVRTGKRPFNLYTVILDLNTDSLTGSNKKSSRANFIVGLTLEQAEKVSNLLSNLIAKNNNLETAMTS